MPEGGPRKAQVEKEAPVHNFCASQMSIWGVPCKNEENPASMSSNCNHVVRPVPTPPDVYTGRTLSACRPGVGVGDQHDVVHYFQWDERGNHLAQGKFTA